MNTVYDIIGVGIGPFNLGMAAMVDKMKFLNCIFFDENPEFNWHAGMMIPGTRLQVPFYADLVTVVDPTSKYTYLNYLKEKQRLFRFAIHENNFVTRKEYNDYCRWVVEQLDSLRFNHQVRDVQFDESDNTYVVNVFNKASQSTVQYKAKHLVIGVGTVPYVPDCANNVLYPETCFESLTMTSSSPIAIHSSKYMLYKEAILQKKKVCIIGSGQSAAEIFYDLLKCGDRFESLAWYTRSERFYPMEYSKLTLEMTSPDYIDHFYSLAPGKKKEVLARQSMLYKGINFSLINEIYDTLYAKDIDGNSGSIIIQASTSLESATRCGTKFQLGLYHEELVKTFEDHCDVLILATGYEQTNPSFLNVIINRIKFDDEGRYQVKKNYSIDSNNSVFVQNAELHTHGFSAPDLGMGPYRNATILNTIAGYDHFNLEKKIAFRRF